MKLIKLLIGCFVPRGGETEAQMMMRELDEELNELFRDVLPPPRSPWKRAKEAIRRRRNGAKVAPATGRRRDRAWPGRDEDARRPRRDPSSGRARIA